MKMKFGKHKDKEISEIPTQYLKWGAEKFTAKDIRKSFIEELKQRNEDVSQYKNREYKKFRVTQGWLNRTISNKVAFLQAQTLGYARPFKGWRKTAVGKLISIQQKERVEELSNKNFNVNIN